MWNCSFILLIIVMLQSFMINLLSSRYTETPEIFKQPKYWQGASNLALDVCFSSCFQLLNDKLNPKNLGYFLYQIKK